MDIFLRRGQQLVNTIREMELCLFGPVRAVRDQEDLNLGSIGQKTVLALLALHAGRLITVDRLVELLWGEEPPNQAVHAIRVYVSRLRSILEPDPTRPKVLVTESGGYRLAVGVEAVDVLHFEHLAAHAQATSGQEDPGRLVEVTEEAFRLWTDEPLAEFSGHEFAEEARRRLDLMRADLIETWAESRLALGGDGGIVERIQEILDQDPYRERAWELLALAHYRGGRQTEALRTLRRARAELEGIGLEPGPSLTRLEEAIFRHDVSLLLPPKPGAHNLPLPIDRFVGRHAEMEHLRRLLARYRLVTVTGPGGSGKTRLAVEVARSELARHRHGVWMVDLAPIEEDQLVAFTMEALETSPRKGRGDIRELIEHLQERDLLLLLDNAEHLIDEIARFAVAVLENCPGVQVLATSREPLRAPGEAAYSIGPLQVPGPEISSAAELAEYDAVALLRERAGSGGSLDDDEETVREMASIVRRLDGIPLAIELAATRLATLPIGDLSRRIDDVFSSLGVGPRTVLPRHRTLRAAFDWSYQLLTPAERDAFDVLSLFRGDFDLPAAVSVIGTISAEPCVEGLVSKSMLTRIPGRAARYRLLEPLRQIGAERLQGARLSQAAARRDHHFSRIGQELLGDRSSDDPSLQARFTFERRHLEATIEHLLDEGQVEKAAHLAVGLATYWKRLGFYERGIGLFKSVLAQRPAGEILSELFLGLAWLLAESGEFGECEQMITSASAAGCDVDSMEWSNFRGSLEAERGDMRSAEKYLTRGVESARKRDSDLLPALLINVSAVTAWMGAVELSARYAAEASDIARRMWRRPQDPLLFLLEGIQARMNGDLELADRQLEMAARGLYTTRSDFHLGLALTERATVSIQRGDLERARELVEETFAGAVHRDRGPPFIRMRGQTVLARIAWHERDEFAVRHILAELVEQSVASGSTMGLAMAGDLAAEVALAHGQEEQASEMLASTSLLRYQLAFTRDAYEEEQYQQLHARLPDTTVGHPAALSAIITEFLREPASPGGGRPGFP